MIDFCRESLETRLRTVVTQVKYLRLGESSVISLPVVLHHIALTKLSQEILVMGDDYKLEVRVIPAFVDDAVRPECQQMDKLRRHDERIILTQPDWLPERRCSPYPGRWWAHLEQGCRNSVQTSPPKQVE